MGWTPKGRKGETGVAKGEATPAPRRRRRPVPEAEPPATTGARPPGGVKNTAIEKRDARPHGLRIQPGKRWAEIITAVKAGDYTWAQFVEGLDPEELTRGQLKDKHGGFTGRPPSLVPREFHLACQREMKRRFELLFSDQVLDIADEYLKMAQSKDLKPETKAKMLQYAMERVFGGIPKDITIKQEAPWEQMVLNVMRSPEDTALPAHLEERYGRYQERQGGGVDSTNDE